MQYFYNENTLRLHIKGLCKESESLPYRVRFFSSYDEALKFDVENGVVSGGVAQAIIDCVNANLDKVDIQSHYQPLMHNHLMTVHHFQPAVKEHA